MTSNENKPAPTYVRSLAVAVLALIAFAVLTPSWDWGAGIEGRITNNSLGAFFETELGHHVNTNFRIEHNNEATLGFELLLAEPTHAMVAWVAMDGAVRRLFPLDADQAPLFEDGRHDLPFRIDLADRRAASFVVAVYSPEALDWSTAEEALSQVARPLTNESLRQAHLRGDIHSVFLPALDASGRAK